MEKQLFDLTKENWIAKAKESKAGYVKCFIPVIQLSYMHDVHPINRDINQPFRKFINEGGINKLVNHLHNIDITPIYSADNIISVLNAVDNGEPSLQDQFLNKDRNIFIIDISDPSCLDKNIVIVCEYIDQSNKKDRLADHTVDYDAVKTHNEQKEAFASLFKRMRENKSTDVSDDFPF